MIKSNKQMEDQWLNQWNNRYKQPEFAYGSEPNAYLKEHLPNLSPGKILFGAEGEGRNAVYAGTLGWSVSAFDISEEGKKKAMQLAANNDVKVDYQVGLLPDLDFPPEQFDVIALIYAHFPPDIRSDYHQRLHSLLKPGGHILFEAFGKNHLSYRTKNPKVGGPPELDFLISVEELQTAFEPYEVFELEEKEVELSEGLYHNGIGSVIRFRARKQ